MFEAYAQRIPDGGKQSLHDRTHRLSLAIDAIWKHPAQARAIKAFNQCFGKFLRAVNRNDLFEYRVVFAGKYTDNINDLPEDDDTRVSLIIREDHLHQSFDKVMDALVETSSPESISEIQRGLAIVVATFYVVQLWRCADSIDRASGTIDFPEDLLVLLDHSIATHPELYADTALGNRTAALQLMMDIDSLTPENEERVREAGARMRDENICRLVGKNSQLRLRLCQLYGKILPYLTGALNLEPQTPEERQHVLKHLDLLLKQLAIARTADTMRADQRAQIRNDIERPLAQAIARNCSNLGWVIYRGFRSRKTGSPLRTSYLFKDLLGNDGDRLAVLNLIYANKKRKIDSSHPQYAQMEDLFLKKYQPLFEALLSLGQGDEGFILGWGKE